MTRTDGISQTPATPFSDKFCIFCTLTGDALARFFHFTTPSDTSRPDENISSEKSLSRVAHSTDTFDHHTSAPDGCMASVSTENCFVSKSELQSKSEEHTHKSCNGMPFDSPDSYLSRNPILSGSRSPVSMRNIYCGKNDEPVVFAEMNQMLTRVGIKLERSAPPSRRGSPPRASTPSCETHVSPSGQVSPSFPTGLTSFINYDRLASPVTIFSGSNSIPRSVNEDFLVTVEGDAHLLRLQQACQEQMNQPSFSRRESVEGGVSTYEDDAYTLSPKPPISYANEGHTSPSLIENSLLQSDDVKNGEEKNKKEDQLCNKFIDRSKSGGSSSTSFFSSELVYSASTSHASTLSSMCITPLSHSSSTSVAGQDRDSKMVDISIAMSEVLQLQGKAAEAVVVVETLLKNLECSDCVKLTSTCSAADRDRDIGVRSTIGTLTLSSTTVGPCGSDKRMNRIPSPTFTHKGNTLGPDASPVPVTGHVLQNMPSSDHSISKDRINYNTHRAVCYRRLGVLYKVLGRLPEAERSLECYIALKKEMDLTDGLESEGRNDIANAYCLLATIVDEMAGRSEDALEYERLALELMANSR